MLNTQVLSASALSVAAEATIREILNWCPRERWCRAMDNMSQYDRTRQIALYLLCWGETVQVRLIFKPANDYCTVNYTVDVY
jgi:hypothetical protein